LGEVYHKQGKLEDASLMFTQASLIARHVEGPENVRVACGISRAGVNLKRQGLYDEAMEKFEEAYQMFCRLCGEDHEQVAKVLSNMANVLVRQGKGAEALAMRERALGIKRRVFGSEHEEVAISMKRGFASCVVCIPRRTRWRATSSKASGRPTCAKAIGMKHLHGSRRLFASIERPWAQRVRR